MSFEAATSIVKNPSSPTGAVQLNTAPMDVLQNKEAKPSLNLYIQPKLTVGSPDDPYEKEADAVADQVMRTPEQTFIQRKCTHCEEEEKISRKLSETITPFIQTKSESTSKVVPNPLSKSILSSKGRGPSMDRSTQTFMDNRFGVDFKEVKVHNDGDAAQMNRQLDAKAFTVGNDIYFNEGQYQPHSSEGKRLLAHELTHVVQQGRGDNIDSTIHRKPFGHNVIFDAKDVCPPQAEVQQSGVEEKAIAEDLYGNAAIQIDYLDQYNIYIDYEYLLDEWKPIFIDCVPAEVSETENPVIPPEQMQCRADVEFTGETEMTEATVTAPNGIRLHTTPDPYDCDYMNEIGISSIVYKKDKKVVVIASGNIRNTGWVKLQTLYGHEGWIEERFIARTQKNDLKDAVTKEKYVIQAGDNLEGIIRQQYKDYSYTTGNDRRTIAHALYILNKDESGAFYFEGNGESWWKDFLDSDFAETRRIYATIRLKEGKIIRLPSKAYIDLLRDQGQVGVRPEWKNTAIEFARSIEGFVEGVAYGFAKAIVDTVVGLWDLLKGIFTGELFEQAYDFYKQIEANGIKYLWELIKGFFIGVFKEFESAWNNPNPYKKWFFFGEIIGMILFEIIVAYFTAGAGLARHVGKLEKVFDAIPGLRKLAAKAATKVDDIPPKQAAALGKIKNADHTIDTLGDMPGQTRKMLRDPDNEKLLQSLKENPDIKAEDLFIGDTAGSSAPRGFKPDGTIPRAGTPERPVVNQGPHPTCGPRSCEMATVTMGQKISPEMLEKMLAEAGTTGVTTDQMVYMLKWNKVVGEAKTGFKVTDLANATKGGNPALAVIKTPNPKHPLHAVVVDGVTERLGQPVVAIRNPWGIQYFQTVEQFNKVFTGNAVTILHSY